MTATRLKYPWYRVECNRCLKGIELNHSNPKGWTFLQVQPDDHGQRERPGAPLEGVADPWEGHICEDCIAGLLDWLQLPVAMSEAECTGCGTTREACEPGWAQQKKCCPDCSHMWPGTVGG